jgi:hypothetical protein
MRFYLILAALPLLVAYGLAEGVWTNRWYSSRALERAATQLRLVPQTVGDWQAGEDLKLEDWELKQGEIGAYLKRRYVRPATGDVVSVLIVCGRPGPIALHPPDVCFEGVGYQPVRPPVQMPLTGGGGGRAALWEAVFQKPSAAVPDRLHTRWAWSDTGDWLAADHPRMQFARSPILYKLYLVRQVLAEDGPAGDDPSADFLRLFLPELNKCLFGNGPS